MEIKINGTTFTMSDRSWELTREGARLAEERRLAELAQAELERDVDQAEIDWASRTVQTIVIPGARQGVHDSSQARFAGATRREAKRRGLRVTISIACSQRVAHVRIIGEVRS